MAELERRENIGKVPLLKQYYFKVITTNSFDNGVSLTVGANVPNGPEYLADEEFNQQYGYEASNQYRWDEAGVSLETLNSKLIQYLTKYVEKYYKGRVTIPPSSENLTRWRYNGFRTEDETALKMDIHLPFMEKKIASNKKRRLRHK